jgi:hemerythrin-like domain-containing protein
MCTYCGCESIEVIGRFMAEHTDIVNAAGVLRRAVASGDRGAVERAADGVAALLHPHTRAEEVGLFTVMRRQEEFTDHIDSLCAEHTTLDEQLAAVRAGQHDRLEEFISDLRHHIDREDNGLFPASAIALEGPDWAEVDEITPPAP